MPSHITKLAKMNGRITSCAIPDNDWRRPFVQISRHRRGQRNRQQQGTDSGDQDDDDQSDGAHAGDDIPDSDDTASTAAENDPCSSNNSDNQSDKQEQQDVRNSSSASDQESDSHTATPPTTQCRMALMPPEPAYVHFSLHGEVLPLGIFEDLGRGVYGWFRNDYSHGNEWPHAARSLKQHSTQSDDTQETAEAAIHSFQQSQPVHSNTTAVEFPPNQLKHQHLDLHAATTAFCTACLIPLPDNTTNEATTNELQITRQAPIPIEDNDNGRWENINLCEGQPHDQARSSTLEPKPGIRKNVRSVLRRLRKNVRPGKTEGLCR